MSQRGSVGVAWTRQGDIQMTLYYGGASLFLEFLHMRSIVPPHASPCSPNDHHQTFYNPRALNKKIIMLRLEHNVPRQGQNISVQQ